MVNNIILLFNGYNSQLCSSGFHSVKLLHCHTLICIHMCIYICNPIYIFFCMTDLLIHIYMVLCYMLSYIIF